MNPSIFGHEAQGRGAGRLMPISKQRDLHRVVDDSLVLPRGAGALTTEVEQMRNATATRVTTTLRRVLFFWLRIYVHSTQDQRGKDERINIAIPIPIPVVGALFKRRLDFTHAVKAVTLAHDNPQEAGRYLESCMAVELIRVETDNAARGKSELVVIGLD